MKRSQINAVIRDFEAMLAEHRFALPPFLSFTPEEWRSKGHEYDEIRDNALGWDITDYGEGTSPARVSRSSRCATATPATRAIPRPTPKRS